MVTYKRVYIYTQPSCPACKIVKEFLNYEDIYYEEYDITKDPAAKKRMIKTHSSYSTPTVVVGKNVIRGLDLDYLERLLKEEDASQ